MQAAIAMSDENHDAKSRLRVLAGGAADRERDAELVRAFLVGDEDAFEELWRRHEATVHAVVRRYARSPEDARDLVQRAFIRALSASRRGFPSPSSKPFLFRAWVLRIAANLGKNHARDEARWRTEPLDGSPEAVDGSPAPEDVLLRRERERLVRKAVLELPRRQREVLTLRLDADLSFEEVAEVLGITQNNAKVCFHHATRRLRALVTEATEGDGEAAGRENRP